MRRLYPFVAIFLVLLGLAWGLTPRGIDRQAEGSGAAAIGGAFALTDQHGNAYTQEELKRHYSLVFFGFASCPDICPAGLLTMTAALDAMPKALAAKVTPVFVTLDPARDTVGEMAEYAANFHPRLVALTGTQAQVDTAANSYKVYANKVALSDSALGYTIDHSAYIYLMGPDGEYITHFDHAAKAQEMAAELTAILEKQP